MKPPASKYSCLYGVCGFIYVLITTTSTMLSLMILAPSISNDNLWPNMNTTGVQTYLGDLYNAKLATGVQGPLDLFDSNGVIYKDYSGSMSFISTRPAAARAVLLSRLPLHEAIRVMRAVPFSENIQTLSMPCWADLNRKYEMAHTEMHQVLCNLRRTSNAAFYLEALFRNLGPADLATSTYLPAIRTSVFDYVEATPGGLQWVSAMLAPIWLPIPEESLRWQSHGIGFFQNSFQNYFLEGTHESITIINALGMRQSITISNFIAMNRPKTQWTSEMSYPGFWNDIDACVWLQASTIRAAPNNFQIMYGANWESWDYYILGSTGSEATKIIQTSLSPLTVIDVFLVPPPPSLLALVAVHQSLLNSALLLNPNDYLGLAEPVIDMTPSEWVQPGAVYYGGNPLCSFGVAKPFVQTSFGYYDVCGAQIQHTIQLSRANILFATMATSIQPSGLASVCALSSQNTLCIQILTRATALLHRLINTTLLSWELDQATQDIFALNTTFVQWATINGTNLVLHKSMVSNNSHWDAWSFVGWMTMYEWAIGAREVYTFEGDWDIWTLMSCHQNFVSLAANDVELPQSACQYLWIVCTYVSLVVVFVLLLVIAFGAFVAKFHVDARNLFFANRLIGGSWIGRPFLFVRGMTAILILATSPTTLNSYGGFTKLDFTPRPLWQICLLAGEVSWVTYVINDMLLPLSKPHSRVYAPLSSLLTWVAAVVIESSNPYKAQATIARVCTILSFSRGLECKNGDIHIGTFNRVLLLSMVATVSVPAAYMLVLAAKKTRIAPDEMLTVPVSFYLTSSSEAFLFSIPNKLDVAACVLSGLIPFRNHLFDIKNWTMIATDHITDQAYDLFSAVTKAQSSGSALASIRELNTFQNHQTLSSSTIRWIGAVGLIYMGGAIVTSFVYLFASKAYFDNDFLWLGFSDTNTQAFLVNWFNVQLQMANSTSSFQVDNSAYGDYATTNNITQYNVFSSALYAIRIQDEANTLSNVVQGLRAMDSCNTPWISTAYCFADFGRRWPMAFSAERQERCERKDVDNGAMYLETILRNVNWPSLSVCWGSALESAVFDPIRITNVGASWVNAMKTFNSRTINDEVHEWQGHGITRFTTLWQNYKSLGITESFLISNYAGHGSALTLKKSNSSFHLTSSTAFKMCSPFANYLTTINSNNSVLSDQSLIRTSSSFAFLNATTEDIFLATEILTAPLDPLFVIFQRTIGPYGVVDIKRVAVPQNLRNLYHAMRMFLLSKLSSCDDIQSDFWAMYTQYFFFPQPSAWDSPALMWDGDINCGLDSGGYSTFPLEYFSSTGLCGHILWDYMKPLTQNLWMAFLAMGFNAPINATGVSSRDKAHQNIAYNAIVGSLSLMLKYMSPDELSQFNALATSVKTMIRDSISLELIQYLSVDGGSSFYFSRVNFFAPTESDFEFFAWLYLLEWVEGKREVISIEGALDTLVTISTTKPLVQELTNATEIPLNVGRFFYAIIFYITTVLFGVGCLVTIYIISCRGYIDGINVISFNYVAGHVWIGRPLMLLRSLTSVALLSTSELNLIAPRAALTSYFQSPPRDILTTLVSSGEICWLVYVFVDTFSVFTGEYTAYYSSPSVVVVTLSVAIWSIAAPTTHSVILSRQCTVVAVDFDVSCVSGVLHIGDYTRFGGLIGVTCASCIVSYVAVRVFMKQPPKLPSLSPLLYSAAKTEFEHSMHVNWEFDGVHYLDKASATMTGVLTFEFQRTVYVADIKTWRVYAIPSNEINGLTSRPRPTHIQYALPLVPTCTT
ncbi:Aste57867_19936 [Aphanomyces stellatus]|uniref:Aste57867_19936 protein n=1 Tax=Aphanomyces stellatus TaxID=120398 RepID=A0A485LDX5_9STRA|nr:hypothetical protein As57867_019870 [Aphanomyces stellatus]VFT96633.1 Aste57867_19936 [Aphanomyces stellatus]